MPGFIAFIVFPHQNEKKFAVYSKKQPVHKEIKCTSPILTLQVGKLSL